MDDGRVDVCLVIKIVVIGISKISLLRPSLGLCTCKSNLISGMVLTLNILDWNKLLLINWLLLISSNFDSGFLLYLLRIFSCVLWQKLASVPYSLLGSDMRNCVFLHMRTEKALISLISAFSVRLPNHWILWNVSWKAMSLMCHYGWAE